MPQHDAFTPAHLEHAAFVRDALRQLGIRRLVLGIHVSAFPAAELDIGHGPPLSIPMTPDGMLKLPSGAIVSPNSIEGMWYQNQINRNLMARAGTLQVPTTKMFSAESLRSRAKSEDQPRYQGYSGTKYKYDLSKFEDRIQYNLEPSAKLMDKFTTPFTPGVSMDRYFGQYGAGVK